MTDTPSQLNTDLETAVQAQTMCLYSVDIPACTSMSMSQTWGGGKLIFSDSPETPTVHGQLYYDTTLSATVGSTYNRVYLYHVNGNSSKMKFAVLLKNLGSSTGTLTVQKKGTAGPTTAFAYAGKLAVQRFLSSSAGTGVNVNASSWVQLDSTFGGTSVTNGNLMHGIWDYSFTQPHEIMVVAVLSTEDPVTVGPTLSLLTRDASHQRGTFASTEKVFDTAVTVDTVNGMQQTPWADGTVDTFVTGTDKTDGTSMTLAGNYGVLYRCHLNVTSSDARKVAVIFNPRGGAWGGGFWAEAGVYPEAKFTAPGSTNLITSNNSGSLVGEYDPASVSTIWFQTMPAGGSALPCRIVLTPWT